MQICVIGTGYVGLVAGVCLANEGNTVICVDKDAEKIHQLKNSIPPIYEPGLEELLKTNVSSGRLRFTENLNEAVKNSSVCFIAVGTPQNPDGSADLTEVINTAHAIANAMEKYTVIVNKSTVPVGTAQKITEIIASSAPCGFDVVSNPEFLKQGAAIEDFRCPDRIILGSESEKALEIMRNLYRPFAQNPHSIITMDTKSAEMVKYASNSFLAVKISYINEIANICEKVGADINQVRTGMIADKRIGSEFLSPGIGFGGSCFPKDLGALIKIASENNCNSAILQAAVEINARQREIFVEKILHRFDNDVSGKTFGVWGVTFKPDTNDMREAPSVTVINRLTELGGKVQIYDPMQSYAKSVFHNTVQYCDDAYAALTGADALLIITEWEEFKTPNFERIKDKMKRPLIFDGRNLYDASRLHRLGLEYHPFG